MMYLEMPDWKDMLKVKLKVERKAKLKKRMLSP